MDLRNKIRFEVSASALEKWDRTICAADKDEKHSISIYSTVGEYGDGSGMTAKIVSAILRRADGADVTVNINSGGGDFFEGLAIHSLLSEYEGNVTVKVLGLAASAASVIAMAGDKIEVAKSGFIMIHNAWTMALGNKEVMSAVADMLDKFDDSMSDLYAAKTNIDKKTIEKMMKAETWLAGEDALELNFASALLGKEDISKDETKEIPNALKKMDVALAKAGMPRSERRELIKELNSTPRAAADTVTPCADIELKTKIHNLLNTIKGT